MDWLVLVGLLSASQMVSGLLNSTSIIVNNEGFEIYPCLQVNHREGEIDSSMMGQWYVIEIIQHQDGPKRRVYQGDNICPKLNLFMPSSSFIRMNWQEDSGDINYNFKMVDPENRGFWMVWNKQSGSMLNKVYDQFSGSVQVMEAIPNRMVLTFCSTQQSSSQPSDGHKHYSIIMVRNITIPLETREIHQTLQNYKLPEVGVHLTCRNEPSDGTIFIPSLTVILSSVFLLLSGAN